MNNNQDPIIETWYLFKKKIDIATFHTCETSILIILSRPSNCYHKLLIVNQPKTNQSNNCYKTKNLANQAYHMTKSKKLNY